MVRSDIEARLSTAPADTRGINVPARSDVKRFILGLTPKHLEDLVKVIGHEVESLFDYHRLGMFSNIAIETTSVCNRDCSYCPVSDNELYNQRKPKPMSDTTFKNVVDQLAEIGYRGTVALQHYGEPLLDKKIDSRVSYVREKLPNAFIVMNSNGDFLTPERFIGLVNSGMDLIHVTNHNLDGTIEPKLKATLDYLEQHPEVRSHFKMRGGVSTFYNRGGLIQNLKQVRRLEHCVDESYSANVDADGNVVLCANDYTGEHRYGNVNERSVLDIWYDNAFKDLRSRKKRGNFDLDICKRCVGG